MAVSRRRATLATLVGSTANTFVVSLQALILTPLFLRAIGPQLYGAWLGSGEILVWMQAFDLGLPNLMIQRIGAAYGQRDSKTVAEYFAAGMAAMAGVALIVGFSVFGFSRLLPGWMGLAGNEASTLKACFVFGGVAAAVNVFSNSVVGFSRGIQNTLFMNSVMVVSSLSGFAVSLGFVLAGSGLWAIVFGLGARAGIFFLGSMIFTVARLKGELAGFFRVRRRIVREFVLSSPAAAMGGFGYMMMSQSETTLAAIFLKPELAVVFNLTRKAVDVARGFVDMIAFAVYGGFAHLVTSDQRHRTLQVHAEIHSLRLSLAIVLASAYMAVNASLLSVWVGRSVYGGALLTILIAMQFVVTGSSFLMNYLYRATGPVVPGSLALFAEGVLRVSMMIGLMLWIGLPGIPIAGIITGILFWVLAYGWTMKRVASVDTSYPKPVPRVWIARSVLLGIGILICLFVRVENWLFVLAVASGMVSVGAIALISMDPLLHTLRAPLKSILDRLTHAGRDAAERR